MSIAKASREYWDGTYTGPVKSRDVFNPHRKGIRYFGKRIRHEYFTRAFRGMPTSEMRLLEIGCGGSRMLPYFAREFGFSIAGLDYSAPGCEKAKRILDEEGVEGDIFQGDLFDRWPDRSGTFDAVVTFGVVEHFVDMQGCLRSMAQFLKPGGLMITLVPNMCGLIGSAQKRLCQTVYAKHNLVDRECLQTAHERSGFSSVSTEYVGFVNFGVLNLNEVAYNTAEYRIKSGIVSGLRAFTAATWVYESNIHRLPPNKLTSPYVISAAIK